MNIAPLWQQKKWSEGPVVAVALHTGHRVRPDIEKHFKISSAERLREEDPYTGAWVDIADLGIMATRSRFEVDLNRPRDKAVYRTPSDAWGLEVWKAPMPEAIIATSLSLYDDFYSMVHDHLTRLEKRYGTFFIYDLHAYNYRRNGPGKPPEPFDQNPEANIGTGTMDRERWSHLVDGFIEDLSTYRFMNRALDVRENVKFRGAEFPAFVHQNFPTSGCVISIEFKKFWMDEWTGACNRAAHKAIHSALASTVSGVRKSLERA